MCKGSERSSREGARCTARNLLYARVRKTRTRVEVRVGEDGRGGAVDDEGGARAAQEREQKLVL